MGYTHYWERVPELDPKRFEEWSTDVRKIVAAARQGGVVIVGDSDGGEAIINEKEVWLNGEPDHETFVIEQVSKRQAQKGLVFAFCKTAQKPYDIVVVAALIALKARFEERVVISSDGDRADWEPGIALADKVLGTGGDWDFIDNHLEYTGG